MTISIPFVFGGCFVTLPSCCLLLISLLRLSRSRSSPIKLRREMCRRFSYPNIVKSSRTLSSISVRLPRSQAPIDARRAMNNSYCSRPNGAEKSIILEDGSLSSKAKAIDCGAKFRSANADERMRPEDARMKKKKKKHFLRSFC